MGIMRDLSSDRLRFALKVKEDPNSGLKNDTLKSIYEKILMSYRNVLHSDLVGFSSQSVTYRTSIWRIETLKRQMVT